MSVPAYLYKHPAYKDPDVFLCVQVQPNAKIGINFNQAWIVGYIEKADFHGKKRFVPKDARVGINGKMPCDVWNVYFSDLEEPTL